MLAIPVCADFDCEDWDENWLNSLNVDNPDSDTEEVDYDLLPPPLEALEDVQLSILGTPRLC